MKCIKFLLELIWDGTKEEKKRKETWLLFRLFRAANLTSGRSMCPCVACRSPGKLQREPLSEADSVCVFNEEEDLKSDGQTKQVRFVQLATKTFSNLFDSRLLESSRVMTLLSQGRLGERWGEFMVDGCSDLSVPASQELSVPNPVTVRPQG